MKKIILLAITTASFFFTLSASSYSADWLQIETSIVGEKFYIDLDGIRFSGPIVTFWAKNVDRKQEETKTRYSINCENGTGAIRDIIMYSTDGTILKSYSRKDKELQWIRIAPGSFMNDFKNTLCKEKDPLLRP